MLSKTMALALLAFHAPAACGRLDSPAKFSQKLLASGYKTYDIIHFKVTLSSSLTGRWAIGIEADPTTGHIPNKPYYIETRYDTKKTLCSSYVDGKWWNQKMLNEIVFYFADTEYDVKVTYNGNYWTFFLNDRVMRELNLKAEHWHAKHDQIRRVYVNGIGGAVKSVQWL